jgi:hypothetical protein
MNDSTSDTPDKDIVQYPSVEDFEAAILESASKSAKDMGYEFSDVYYLSAARLTIPKTHR